MAGEETDEEMSDSFAIDSRLLPPQFLYARIMSEGKATVPTVILVTTGPDFGCYKLVKRLKMIHIVF